MTERRDGEDILELKIAIARIWEQHPEYTVAEAMQAGSEESGVPLGVNDFYAWRAKDPAWKTLTDEHMERRKNRLVHSVQDIYSRIPTIRLRLAKMASGELGEDDKMTGQEIGAASLLLSKYDPAAKNITEVTGKDGGAIPFVLERVGGQKD